MSFRHVMAVAAALLCTSALAQSEAPATSASASATATTPAASSSSSAAVAASVASAASTAAPAGAPDEVAKVVKILSGDPAAGKAKSTVCAACHGMDGNSIVAQYPRLAGQSEHYIVLQLQAFKSGERADPIMAGFASTLSLQDMHDIGAWYAAQTPKYGVADETLVKLGRSLYRGGDAERGIPACMACHGPAGAGNAGAAYPHLAGQHAEYIRTVLNAWRAGKTWGDSAHASIMPSIAKRLTDQDVLALSSYIQGLHHAAAGGGR